jgi:hypothetical protein
MFSGAHLVTLPPETRKRTPLPDPLPFGRGEGEGWESGGSNKMLPVFRLLFLAAPSYFPPY